jgi:integrase
MLNQKAEIQFHSPLSEFIKNFIKEKRACGYRYEREYQEFVRLDRFLCEIALQSPALPREIVDHWTAKQAYEKPSNQRLRKIRIRQLALYLRRQGLDAYVPEANKTTAGHTEFVPYIFSRQQIRNIIQAADATPPGNRSPLRHLIMPEVFRLLYCCGLRISEVLQLKLSDVNLTTGVLTIRKSKFNKDRLVPLAHSMTARLRRYVSILDKTKPSSILFPSPSGKPYSKITVYQFFRQLLWKCNIPHDGRGRGPRLHDILSQSINLRAGTDKAQIWGASCRCWQPIWDIKTLSVHNGTFILPPIFSQALSIGQSNLQGISSQGGSNEAN